MSSQPSAADFYDAVAEFTEFLVKQGYPPSLLWVKSSDVVVHKWNGTRTYFVWKGSPSDRQRCARSDYQSAVSRDFGIALEAYGKTDRWTICRVSVPRDENHAERLMIPRTGVKHSVVEDPLPTVLVENKYWWWILKRLARKPSPVWE